MNDVKNLVPEEQEKEPLNINKNYSRDIIKLSLSIASGIRGMKQAFETVKNEFVDNKINYIGQATTIVSVFVMIVLTVRQEEKIDELIYETR